MESVSGIYRIVCVKNGRYYYGSSVNVKNRWSSHKRTLRNGTHCNPVVQRSWNKHGEESFRIEIIENLLGVDKKTLLKIEDGYLGEHVGKANCMNIAKKATNPNDMMGKKHSLETRRKMSEAKKGITPINWRDTHTKRANKKRSDKLVLAHASGIRTATYKKISESLKGRDFSSTHKMNISKSLKGRKLSLEHRKRISESVKNQWAGRENLS